MASTAAKQDAVVKASCADVLRVSEWGELSFFLNLPSAKVPRFQDLSLPKPDQI